MPRLAWDENYNRWFQAGISKGVLYVKKDILNDGTGTDYNVGVAWNGLIDVEIENDGFNGTELWSDDVMKDRLYTPEILKGSIEAFSAPNDFNACVGRSNPANGVYFSQQAHKKFGFVYVTDLFNEFSLKSGYMIHILYNCTAKAHDASYYTLDDSGEPIVLQWEFDALPIELEGFRPFTEITIDSTYAPKDKMQLIENVLFGSNENDATLPSPDAILQMMRSGDPTNS